MKCIHANYEKKIFTANDLFICELTKKKLSGANMTCATCKKGIYKPEPNFHKGKMEKGEHKICSYTQNGYRLQLLKIIEPVEQIAHDENFQPYKTGSIYYKTKYQIRENRKIIKTTIQEYQARKIFAQMVTNIVLQLKIC